MPRSPGRYHFCMGSRHIGRSGRGGTGVASHAPGPMRSAPATRSAGFTLVELLISLVIIGIISASVVPSLSEVLADSRQL